MRATNTKIGGTDKKERREKGRGTATESREDGDVQEAVGTKLPPEPGHDKRRLRTLGVELPQSICTAIFIWLCVSLTCTFVHRHFIVAQLAESFN